MFRQYIMGGADALEKFRERTRAKLYAFASRSGYLAADDDWIREKAQHLAEVLRRAAELAENAIILVRGQPSSGKTYVVRSAVAQVAAGPATADGRPDARPTHVVELSAHDYEDDVKCMRALSDRLELLAGSKPDPDAHMLVSQIQNRILHSLRALHRRGAYLVVVIDGFEVFTKGNYDCSVTTGSCARRQGLLYFLSDSMQLREIALAVVYVTSDLNFIDRLEKRVKSRFTFEPVYCFSDYDVTEYFGDARESRRILENCIVRADKDKLVGAGHPQAELAQASVCGRDRNHIAVDACEAVLTQSEDALRLRDDDTVEVTLTRAPSEEALAFRALSVPQHYVLVSLARMHLRGVYPQTLKGVVNDLREMVIHFPSERHAVPTAAVGRADAQALRRVFLELVEAGLVEWVNYTQNNIDNVRVAGAPNDPSGFCVPCRFPKYRE